MAFRNVELIPVLESIVDSMRTTGTYTSTFDGTYTTLITPNTFKKKDVVIIDSKLSAVTFADSESFKVKGDVTAFTSWKNAAPYFDKGNILEIANNLIEKDNSTQKQSFTKYPRIILILDVTKEPHKKMRTVDYENVNILIVNTTKPTYKSGDRLDKNFIPVLHPLYEDFINKLSTSRMTDNSDSIPFISHKATDRYFWGTELNKNINNAKNVVNDYLDAVDIRNLNIRVRNNLTCK